MIQDTEYTIVGNDLTSEQVDVYNVKELRTGEFGNISKLKARINSYFKKRPKSSIAKTNEQLVIATVCGDDDRQSVDTLDIPYRLICELKITDGFGLEASATGFFISPQCVITAGHSVYDLGRGWAKEIEIYPGVKGRSYPFGKATSRRFRSVSGWANDENENYDYGAILLKDDSLYHQVKGFFAYNQINTIDWIQNSGYPEDRPLQQLKTEGRLLDEDTFKFYYNLDTNTGSSGSPIFVNVANTYAAVGIHTQGGCPNTALKLNESMREVWDQWVMESTN